MPIRSVLRFMLLALCFSLLGGAARAEPGKVIVGAYVNKLQDISFRDSRYTIDVYVWFRWKAEGELTNYKPIETMELINGRIDSKTGIVQKTIGDVSYAQVRISATIFKNWELGSFPFDRHRLDIYLEDSNFVAGTLVFEPDVANSRLGDELGVPGWTMSKFTPTVVTKVYKTNYGDVSLPTDSMSEYSRFSFGMDMQRANYGSAAKLLSTVLAATLVAFVAFMIRPVDVDPRFGLPVGALFAVAASAFVVASAVPDSGVLTAADQMHMLAMLFIFGSLVQSAFALKWDESEQEAKWKRADRLALIVFPVTFFIIIGVIIWRALP